MQSNTQSQAFDRLFSEPRLPHKPYCTNDYASGYKPLIRSAVKALEYRHIQPNHPAIAFRLVFDLDRPDNSMFWSPLLAHEDGNLPPPNTVSINPESGNGHAFYELDIPVNISNQMRKPARFLAAIEQAYGQGLHADRAYNGLLCKNPKHGHWETHVLRADPYTLTEMGEHVHNIATFNDSHSKNRINPQDQFVIGRNCGLFEDVRLAAYKMVRTYWAPNGFMRFHAAIRLYAEESNFRLYAGRELSNMEVNHIAKSIAKWVWDKFTPAAFRAFVDATHAPELQSKRGKLSGEARGRASEEKRAIARLMRSEGKTQANIAAELDVTQQTVSNWMKLDE